MRVTTKILVEVGEIEEEWEIEADWSAGDPGVHTYSNGDPGYAPTGDDVDFLTATCGDLTISFEAFIASHKVDEDILYEKICESAQEQYESMEEDYAEMNARDPLDIEYDL